LSIDESGGSANLIVQVGETGIAGAEGATAPETLRQKDRLPRKHSEKWSACAPTDGVSIKPFRFDTKLSGQ